MLRFARNDGGKIGDFTSSGLFCPACHERVEGSHTRAAAVEPNQISKLVIDVGLEDDAPQFRRPAWELHNKSENPSEKRKIMLHCGFATPPQALMPKPRPRRSAASREQRRLRIVAMAPDNFYYQEIAETEGLSRDRVRQIASTAPGERADISPFVALALASP